MEKGITIFKHDSRLICPRNPHEKAGNEERRKKERRRRFSFEVFSIVYKIAGHQLLYINVIQ